MSDLRKLISSCEIQIKSDNSREFEAYGNVKNVKDNVGDIAVDGCYMHSKMPKLLWSHDPFSPPLGPIYHCEEDSKGLFFRGKLSKTARGDEIYVLAMDGAIDEFSMGYKVLDEKYDGSLRANMLHKVDVKEISFVNFACNEHSTLQSIKSELVNGVLPTQRELQGLLRNFGLSKSQAERITNEYHPEQGKKDLSWLRESSLLK